MLHLHWISGNHDTHLFEFFSWRFAVIVISTQWFPFSIHPCTQGLLAFPLTNLHSPGHASIVSTIRLFANSLPLSECKMYDTPNTLNILLQPKNHLCLFQLHRKKDMKFCKITYNVTHPIKFIIWCIAKVNQVNL